MLQGQKNVQTLRILQGLRKQGVPSKLSVAAIDLTPEMDSAELPDEELSPTGDLVQAGGSDLMAKLRESRKRKGQEGKGR